MQTALKTTSSIAGTTTVVPQVLNDLIDVSAVAPTEGQTLLYNSGEWRAEDFVLPSNISATNIANGSVDNTEFQHLNGVSSSIQTQLDGKASTSHTHTLDNLSDVNTTGVQDGYVLRYDGGTSSWFAQRVDTPTAAVVSGSSFYQENDGTSTAQGTNATPSQLRTFADLAIIPDDTLFSRTGDCQFTVHATGTLTVSGEFYGGCSGAQTATMFARLNGTTISGTTVSFTGNGPTHREYAFTVSVVDTDVFDIVATTSTSRTLTMYDGSYLGITFS